MAALAAIVLIHAASFVALSQVRARRAEMPAEAPVQVAFLEERRAQPDPPAPRVRLEDARLPAVTLPAVIIPVEAAIAPPTPTAITVVAATTEAAPVPPATASDEPVAIETADYVRRPTPRYPPLASRMHAHGTVYLRVLVDTEGRARDVRVHRSSGFKLLDDAARECMLDALFKPHREGGRARNSVVIIPIDFLPNMRTASR